MLFRSAVMRCDDDDPLQHGNLFMYLYHKTFHIPTHEMRLREGGRKGHLFIYLSSFLFRLCYFCAKYLHTRTPTKAKYQFRFMSVAGMYSDLHAWNFYEPVITSSEVHTVKMKSSEEPQL